MKVWMISNFWGLPSRGNGRFDTLMQAMRADGMEVVAFTSSFSHQLKRHLLPNEVPAGFNLIHEPGYAGNASMVRLLSHVSFCKNLVKALRKRLQYERPDLIYVACPPTLTARGVISIAKQFDIPCIADVQDLWPEGLRVAVPKAGHSLFSLATTPWLALENSVFRNAPSVISVSKTYSKRIDTVRRQGETPYYYLGEQVQSIPYCTCRESKRLEIIYIGTLSFSYDIHTFIKACARIKEMFPKAQATILGGGPHEDEFRSLNGQLGEPVTFGGYLPKDELSMYMSSSLVAVNAIVASSATSLPNKIFHYAACGLPIVNSVQGELADLLSCSNAGLQYEANNVASLVSSLTKIMLLDKSQYEAMARGARNMAEKYGDRALIEPAIISHVRRVLDERTSSL
ncbi:MAG TPA: hypothetical protein DDZ53_09015 [Firmicutes bacterium]|nr:hypothetical protein [Bacillota bacterium]